nr:hypothetical protein [Bradyrhizobium japonicum]
MRSSIAPADRLDRDIYLVREDFGARAGCAWRETDEADTDLEGVLQNLLSGQYAYPLRIVSFNAVEGWSRDATSNKQKVIRRHQVGEVCKHYLISSRHDNGASSALGDDKVTKRVHTRNVNESDPIILALAEILDEIVGSNSH